MYQRLSYLKPNNIFAPRIYGDITGGVTAAVVALPLALAFGVASGAGAAAGLIGACVLGFFAALFGGTPAQISGPTGPMTVVMVAVIAAYPGNPEFAALVILLAGLLQILFGFMRLGQYVTYIPSAVISGFMTGIGLVVIKLQFPIIFAGFTNMVPINDPTAVVQDVAKLPMDDLLIAVVALVCHLLLSEKVSRFLPAPLFALLTCIGIGLFLPAASFLDPVAINSFEPIQPAFDVNLFFEALPLAAFLAFLGSIDSLLTSLVADTMSPRVHDSDKELVGQGIGNAIAGLLGGIPGAGATMRTVVNIKAGGHSARSGMFHALILLAVAFGLGRFIAYVPQACLAGILLKVGWDIIDWNYLKNLRKIPREKAFIVLLVSSMTVLTDLVTAVVAGLVIAGLVSAKQFRTVQMQQVQIRKMHVKDDFRLPEQLLFGDVLQIKFSGSFSYASARSLLHEISSSAIGVHSVIFDFRDVSYMELSNALAIKEAVQTIIERGILVYVIDPGTEVTRLFTKLDAFDSLPESHFLPLDSRLT